MNKNLLFFLLITIFKINLSAQSCDANFSTKEDNYSTYISHRFTNWTSKQSSKKFLWDFGDGTFSTLKAPTHIFPKNTNYMVCLMVHDTLTNCRDTFCQEVYRCDPRFWHRTKKTITEVSSYYNKSHWDFDDGTKISNYGDYYVHEYKTRGVYKLSHTKICNTVDSTTTTLIIDNRCIANFDFKFDSLKPLEIKLMNSTTVNNPTRFIWDFGDGTYSNLENPVHTYAKDGYFNITLQSLDSITQCSDSVGKNVIVATPPCDTTFEIFNQYGSDIIYYYTLNQKTNLKWDFGDGKTSNEQNGSHVYPKTGIYDLCVSYVCPNKQPFEKCFKIEVKCKASFSKKLDSTSKYKVVVINNSSIGPRYRYQWYFGEGTTTQSTREPSHKYSKFGKYKVCLYVSDDATNCYSQFCDTIGMDSSGKLLKAGAWEIVSKESGNVSINDFLVSHFQIFPNPATNRVVIKINNTLVQYDKLEIINNQGQICISQKIDTPSQNIEVEIANLNKGLYLIKLSNYNENSYGKMIKEND